MDSYVITPEGETEEYLPRKGNYFSLAELQNIVEGMIQIIPCNDDDFVCVLNEEGKLLELDYNPEATNLVNEKLFPGDFIVGKVLITKNKFIR